MFSSATVAEVKDVGAVFERSAAIWSDAGKGSLHDCDVGVLGFVLSPFGFAVAWSVAAFWFGRGYRWARRRAEDVGTEGLVGDVLWVKVVRSKVR